MSERRIGPVERTIAIAMSGVSAISQLRDRTDADLAVSAASALLSTTDWRRLSWAEYVMVYRCLYKMRQSAIATAADADADANTKSLAYRRILALDIWCTTSLMAAADGCDVDGRNALVALFADLDFTWSGDKSDEIVSALAECGASIIPLLKCATVDRENLRMEVCQRVSRKVQRVVGDQ